MLRHNYGYCIICQIYVSASVSTRFQVNLNSKLYLVNKILKFLRTYNEKSAQQYIYISAPSVRGKC